MCDVHPAQLITPAGISFNVYSARPASKLVNFTYKGLNAGIHNHGAGARGTAGHLLL